MKSGKVLVIGSIYSLRMYVLCLPKIRSNEQLRNETITKGAPNLGVARPFTMRLRFPDFLSQPRVIILSIMDEPLRDEAKIQQ